MLYGPAGKRWAMTERNGTQVLRSANSLHIGPSAMSWERGALTVRIDEVTAPLPSRVRGLVRLYPQAIVDHAY
ncbi:MAG TPA: carotenoid 1,2-hydratase, partial [Casimicrobiaceae bacterium]